jgi:hypothetical protein
MNEFPKLEMELQIQANDRHAIRSSPSLLLSFSCLSLPGFLLYRHSAQWYFILMIRFHLTRLPQEINPFQKNSWMVDSDAVQAKMTPALAIAPNLGMQGHLERRMVSFAISLPLCMQTYLYLQYQSTNAEYVELEHGLPC